jgi:uncharacterized membrane protein YheB (UPF0754 family)
MQDSHPVGNPPLRFRILVLLPWLLFVTLLVTIFIEIPIANVFVFGFNLTFDGFIRIICVSGLIGFLTNWIAITMLFRPTEKRPLLGQGLIPAQKKVIAQKLALAIQKNLINSELIHQRLIESNITEKLLLSIENRVSELSEMSEFRESIYLTVDRLLKNLLRDESVRDEFAQRVLTELGSAMPIGSVEKIAFSTYVRFRGNEAKSILNQTIQQIPSILYDNRSHFDGAIEALPLQIRKNRHLLEQYIIDAAQKLVDEIDIQSIIYDNLNSYDEKRLEWLIKTSTMDQLNYIKYLGSVLGMLGGLVIWNPIFALITLGGGLAIYLSLDNLLFKLK